MAAQQPDAAHPTMATECLWVDAERLASSAHASTSSSRGEAAHAQPAAATPMPTEQAGSYQAQDATTACACSAGSDVDTALARAVKLLRAGEVVALPTETVYGLAANALDAAAVGKIFAAKQRPQDNPLIVHVSSLAMLAGLYPDHPGPGSWQLPASYAAAVEAFWPGPLTIVLPRSPLVPDCVTAGHDTMAVRLPAHPVARALIERCGFPLAAPSANSSGRPSPTLASHVLEDLAGRIPLVLDGGPCDSGVESTVLDALRSPPVVLRPGGITVEALAGLAGLQGLQVYRRQLDPSLEEAPTTPGMKYRHYSPRAQVVLLEPAATSDSAAGGGGSEAGGSQGRGSPLHAALAAALAAEVARLQAEEGHRVEHIGLLRTSLPGAAPGFTDPALAAAAAAAASASGAAGATASVQQPAGGPSAASGQRQPLQYVLGDLSRPSDVARELFKALRCMDEVGVRVIVVEGVRDADEGLAIMNRLRKAAGRTVHVSMPA